MAIHKLNPNGFSKKKKVAQGTFGLIYKGRARISTKNKQAAIKELRTNHLKKISDLFDMNYEDFLSKFYHSYNATIEKTKKFAIKQKAVLDDGKIYIIMEPFLKKDQSKLKPIKDDLKSKKIFDQVFQKSIELLNIGYLPTFDCFHIYNGRVYLTDLDNLVLQEFIRLENKSHILRDIDFFYTQFFHLINELNRFAKKHYNKSFVELLEREVKNKKRLNWIVEVLKKQNSLEMIHALNKLLFHSA